jgi:hypothetical protein
MAIHFRRFFHRAHDLCALTSRSLLTSHIHQQVALSIHLCFVHRIHRVKMAWLADGFLRTRTTLPSATTQHLVILRHAPAWISDCATQVPTNKVLNLRRRIAALTLAMSLVHDCSSHPFEQWADEARLTRKPQRFPFTNTLLWSISALRHTKL